jgi:hypothetical protein
MARSACCPRWARASPRGRVPRGGVRVARVGITALHGGSCEGYARGSARRRAGAGARVRDASRRADPMA